MRLIEIKESNSGKTYISCQSHLLYSNSRMIFRVICFSSIVCCFENQLEQLALKVSIVAAAPASPFCCLFALLYSLSSAVSLLSDLSSHSTSLFFLYFTSSLQSFSRISNPSSSSGLSDLLFSHLNLLARSSIAAAPSLGSQFYSIILFLSVQLYQDVECQWTSSIHMEARSSAGREARFNG